MSLYDIKNTLDLILDNIYKNKNDYEKICLMIECVNSLITHLIDRYKIVAHNRLKNKAKCNTKKKAYYKLNNKQIIGLYNIKHTLYTVLNNIHINMMMKNKYAIKYL